MTHLKWIDVSKGIGIILVIIGHNNFNPYIMKIIYTFHMPLFFFINGYLFHYVKYRKNTYTFIYKKFKRLVVPYFITNIIILCTFTLLSFFKLYSPKNSISPLESLIGTFYGVGDSKLMFNLPSWFLLCLFCASLILYMIAYFHDKYGLLTSIIISFLFIVFGFGISKHIFMPWSFDIACVSIIFMLAGYLANYYKVNWINNNSYRDYYILIAIFILFIVITFNGNVDMNLRIYSNVLFFGIGGLIGTYLTIEFAKKICIKENILVKLLAFTGQSSLIIFLYEYVAPAFFLDIINIFIPLKDYIHSSPVLNAINMLVFTLIAAIIIKRLPIFKKIYYE